MSFDTRTVDRLTRLEIAFDELRSRDVYTYAPSASVYSNVAVPLTSGANTPIAFNQTEWDTSNFHSNSVNNTRMVAPIKGKYEVFACVQFAAGAGTYRYIVFARNGSGVYPNLKGLIEEVGNSAADATALTSSALFDLNAGDYVEVWGSHNAGVALNATVHAYAPFFQMIFKSRT